MRVISLAVFLIVSMVLPINSSFAAVPSVGVVKYLRGHVVAVRSGEEVRLKKGDPIFEGDLIKTGRRSSVFAAMKGDKNNSIRMGQKSQLEVQKYSISAGQVVGGFLRGLIGIFTVELNRLRKGSNFTMKTPTAVLGVRGTVWGSVVKADGSTTFAVKRGSIAIKMGGKSVLLRKGQSVTVTKSGVVSPVKATPKALDDALDSDGNTFDNTATEAAALVVAEAEAKAKADALALAATEAEALLKAAKEAAKEAESNPADAEIKEKASALADKAEAALEAVVVAAELSTAANSGAQTAKNVLDKAEAGIPVINLPAPSGGSSTPTSSDSTPSGQTNPPQGSTPLPGQTNDPTAGFEPGAAGSSTPTTPVITPVVKPAAPITGGGGAPASPV